MEINKYAILMTALVIFTMPVKQGNMLKSEVTPAPPLDFTKMIGKSAMPSRDSAESTTSAVNKQQHTGDADQDVDASKSEEIVQVPTVFKKSTKKKLRRIEQPVCKYGMSEIFLFGNSNVQNADHVFEKPSELSHPEDGNYSQPTKVDSSIADLKTERNESSGKSEDGEENMKLEVDDMESFEEWKHLKLQEQESRMAEINLVPVRTVRAKKTQVNYASQDCGAKVLATNKEAKHVSAILDENRDMYMLNPCSTSIWFVIELCEPIQVQQLQLGNLELFSSAPKEFTVSVSERYPARDWHSLGTFHATNERNLQTFVSQTEEQMFAKYIKFEMISHFSNEHFCPLTLVRVLGVSMVDEFDESEQQNIKDEASEELAGEPIVDDSAKADSGAINTVLSMVKNAMDHVLSNGGEDSQIHKLPQVEGNNSEVNLDNYDTERTDPMAESEVTLVMNETEVAGPRENSTHSFITLIETGHGEDISEYLKNLSVCSPRKIPLCIPKFIYYLSPISQKLNVHMCWFLEFFCKVSLAGCLVHYPYNYSALGILLPISGLSIPPLSTRRDAAEPGSDDGDTGNATHIVTYPLKLIESPDDSKLISTSEEVKDAGYDMVQSKLGDVRVHSSKSKNTLLQAEEEDNSTAKHPPSTSDKNTNDTPSSEVKHPMAFERNLDSETNPTKKMDGIDQVRVDSENPIVPPIDHDTDLLTLATNDTQVGGNNTTDENASKSVTAVENSTESYANDNAAKSVPDMTAPESKPTHPPVVINPGTNQKDSVFMRLSNRIRVLEQNMSLSSDYLETLSRRYKKQMDEMQRAFNQTTSKLTSTSRKANENDARQTELIQQAQVEISILKERLLNLSVAHDQLNMQLVERHVCLILFEVVIFLAILVTCLGRRMTQVRVDLQRAETMIEDLQSILAELQCNPIPKTPKPNGHCSPIPFGFDDPEPPSRDAISKYSKKHKRRSVTKLLPEDSVKAIQRYKAKNAECESTAGIHQICGKQSAVEEVGNKIIDGREDSCSRYKQQSWNGNAIALKIPNGHFKGRK